MDWWQALLLGFLQGATELFPVSSLGHAVLVPRLLGWHNVDQSDPSFLPFIVLLHLGTASALLWIFRHEWAALAGGFFRAVYRGRLGDDPNEKLALLLLAGTVPTGLLGVFLQTPLKKLFASPRAAAAFLVANAAIMAGGELLRRRAESRRRGAASGAALAEAPSPNVVAAEALGGADQTRLGWAAAVVVGLSQSLALLPGISRSGSTITSGLLSGLTHESAARFSFLLATPIILAAGLLEVPTLGSAGARLPIYLAAAVLAGLTAYVSTRFLLRYFRSGRLDPFAAYCLVLGLVGLYATR